MTSPDERHSLNRLYLAKFKKYQPLVLVLVALIVTYIIQITAPSAAVKPDSKPVINVNVIDVRQQIFTPSYSAYGTVIAKSSLRLIAQVEGRLHYLADNVIAGGVLNIDDDIFQQDPADLSALLAQRQAEVEIASAQLSLELGQQRIAEKDYKMMQNDFNENEWQLDLELLLRKPQLAQARAQLSIARNALTIAERDLERSQWRSDKRYFVESKSVSQGDYLVKGDEIAKLVDITELRVPIYLPRELAAKVTIGQVVSLYQPDTQRTVTAKISHILPILENKVQLQKVFAEYQPATNDLSPLIIGDFVEATLLFAPIKNTLNVPLSAIDDNYIWLVTANSTLKREPVTIVYQDKTSAVIINTLSESEQIISNKMHAPQAHLSVNIVERF
ncbi:HlyD family efflux transporter periplasmic adaptor subunit [Shewanella gelidimarina]|uniref:efflux RND transporter periplasmic adaptor subunit n=1 Tax=Shewanella gelidimarina TaxID=56813 RepID=UPI00200EFD19|nr:HlyD family efflux transporter periplasmic adaptor subunit [Shewanella gelidimarina]MCL1058079.1 HlyD family efflux transporter periplasmic adaptor subunit [Shewanella gelidimarina]